MDAHTARCLQLSTSIQPPQSFNGPYRHNRFDSMNRSRYQPQQAQQQQQQQRVPQRANSLPPQSRYQQQQQQQGMNPAVFKQNFQNPMMGSGMGSVADMSPASNFDASSVFTQSSNVSPNTPFSSQGHWDPTFAVDMKQMQPNFLEQQNDLDFTNPFGMTTDGLDLIHLNEQDHQTSPHGHPMSPDRRSLSSNGSGEQQQQQGELTDIEGSNMPVLTQDIPMATVEEEEPMGEFRASARAQHSHSRSNSRAPAMRASSARRYRRAPYSFDGHRRSSSVMSNSSVGSVALSMPPTQCCSPVNECANDDLGLTDFSQLDFGSARPSISTDDLFAMDPHAMHGMPAHFQPDLIAPQPKYVADQMFLQNGFVEDPLFDAAPQILPSNSIPNDHHAMQHSKVDEFAEYAEEPDLFGALSEEQSVPSEEDMNPEDESMKPQEQETRFEGDLYTPRYVRGTGVNREGYCGLCKPGRWLVLKNSAYWYDKSFTHGISAATGQPFDGPKETRRMSGNPDVWEGLCGCCNEWIALISNKKKGTTWFRHAYKCHNHNKNKDANKKKNANKKKAAAANEKAASPTPAPASHDEQQQAQQQQAAQQQAQQMHAQSMAPQQHMPQMPMHHPMQQMMPQGMHAMQPVGGSFF